MFKEQAPQRRRHSHRLLLAVVLLGPLRLHLFETGCPAAAAGASGDALGFRPFFFLTAAALGCAASSAVAPPAGPDPSPAARAAAVARTAAFEERPNLLHHCYHSRGRLLRRRRQCPCSCSIGSRNRLTGLARAPLLRRRRRSRHSGGQARALAAACCFFWSESLLVGVLPLGHARPARAGGQGGCAALRCCAPSGGPTKLTCGSRSCGPHRLGSTSAREHPGWTCKAGDAR